MKHRKLIWGTLLLASANFITKCMGFYNRIFLSAQIGAEGIGLYQLILPLYALTWSITSAGLTTTISRLTAQENMRQKSGNIGRLVKQSVCISLCISLLLSGFLFTCSDWIALHILHDNRTTLSLRLLAFAIPFMAAGSCLRGFFMGLQQMLIPACSQVLEQVLRIGTIMLLAGVFVPKGLSYACFAAVCGIVLGEITSCLFTLYHYFRFKRRHKLVKRPSLSSMVCLSMILSMAMPLTASRIVSSVLSALENILIPQRLVLYGMTNTEALTAYGELTGMVMPLLMLPSVLLMAFSVSLVPEISEACAASQNTRIRRTVSVTLLFTCILGVGAACVFAVFPQEICYIFYRRSSLGNLLFPLAFLCPMLYAQTVLHGLLNGLGEQLFLFWCHMISSLLTIGFVWFGVPYYGMQAFCWGWFCSLLVATLLALHRLYCRTGVRFSISQCFLKPLLAGGAAALLIRYIIQTGTPSRIFFLLCLTGMGILYLIFLGLLGCFSKENLKTLRQKI